MESKTGTKTGQTTTVADVRRVPLEQLSEHSDEVLRRVIPAAHSTKAPVAAFDASL